ncbi:TPA: transferrin-binding protein-like solute binding protein [Neisseria meningitidis]
MNNPLVNQAAMVLPVFLLSACLGGGGGSFDLDSVDTEAPRPAPKYQDVSSEKPKAQKDQGGYGFAMRLKRRNWYPQAKEDEVKLNESDWETTGLPTEPKKLPLKQESVISKVQANNSDNNIYTSPYLTPSNHPNGNTGNGINQPKNEVKDYKDFKYVYSGWFYKHARNEIIRENSSIKGAKNGDDGYIFYHGKEPSRQLPASGTVTYKGVWHFATDVKKSQNFRDIIQPSKKQGDRYSGFSGDDDEQYSNKNESMLKDGQEGYGFTSNLEVDFNNKKLTGKLIRNDKVTNATTGGKHATQYYSLEAQVTGNRFNGKATATDKPGTGETKQHPFVSDSSSLSGGFFGPKGEELGFRFLSDDKKVAVVGSAKTKDKTGNGAAASDGAGAAASGGAAAMPSENGKLTTVLDAVELKSGGKEVQKLDNFSNAAQLVVDGIMIPLLPKDSESGGNQADKGKNGGTDFTYKTTYTPESDKKDTQAQTVTNGTQTASGTESVNGGQAGTKTYEVEVCCSNLNYLKYGLLTRKTAGNTGEGGNGSPTAAQTDAQSMFLQGERTDEKEIPKEQNVVYRGSWYGHIANDTSWSGNASDKEVGNRAEFTVDFADKKITGKLTAENRQAQTFTIEGMIQGNGFEGTAKTAESGFDLDQKNTTRTPKAYITDAKVKGGFYGPKAEELGGWFAYPSDKQTKNAPDASGNGNSASSATVVFGAKRQQPVR